MLSFLTGTAFLFRRRLFGWETGTRPAQAIVKRKGTTLQNGGRRFLDSLTHILYIADWAGLRIARGKLASIARGMRGLNAIFKLLYYPPTQLWWGLSLLTPVPSRVYKESCGLASLPDLEFNLRSSTDYTGFVATSLTYIYKTPLAGSRASWQCLAC